MTPLTSTADHVARTITAMAGAGAVARDDQLAAVQALVDDRRRVLVVQATGWGKSAVYWAATAALRAQGHGPTLVVSPLLALMRDQVSAATRAGLRSATINSTNADEWGAVFDQMANDTLDVLLISPERLASASFASRIEALAGGIGLLVVDEAHCISDWGFDFRPDYQRIAKVLLNTNAPVLATTATANMRVCVDVGTQLGNDTLTLRGDLTRTSLRLGVVAGLSRVERFAWVHDRLGALEGSGIVYAQTVADANLLTAFLDDQGHNVAAYTGAHDSDHRQRVESLLRDNAVKAVVATSALGMGYDKPDLAFVIHVGSPSSPVAYYQQVGRAGRAIDDAVAVLLPSEADDALWNYFATAGIPDPAKVDVLLAAMSSDEPMSTQSLEAATGFRRSKIDAMLSVLHVDGAVERRSPGWVATGADWVFDADKYATLREVRATEEALMRSYARGEACLEGFLRQALDDATDGVCGRCSVCTGTSVAGTVSLDSATVETASLWLRSRDTIIEPRKMWPPKSAGRKGRIVGAVQGRAVMFGADTSFNDVVTAVQATHPSEADVEACVAACLATLGRWRSSWDARPVAVSFVASRRTGQLARRVATGVAAAGKLPLVEAFRLDGPRPSVNVASAVRVGELVPSLQLIDGVELSGPVLVIDDRYSTGWTMTVAAALLRDAGASAVLPLVLTQTP
jgi:ATP-dependent DNA helicase RecQ